MRAARRSFVLLLLLAPAYAAQAQLRGIPDDAKRGEIRHITDMIVEISGVRYRLAPGARIRDPENRLVLPTALPAKTPVKFTLDGSGQVQRVWILSAKEAAER